jgi:hypothetical protein
LNEQAHSAEKECTHNFEVRRKANNFGVRRKATTSELGKRLTTSELGERLTTPNLKLFILVQQDKSPYEYIGYNSSCTVTRYNDIQCVAKLLHVSAFFGYLQGGIQ